MLSQTTYIVEFAGFLILKNVFYFSLKKNFQQLLFNSFILSLKVNLTNGVCYKKKTLQKLPKFSKYNNHPTFAIEITPTM